MNGAQLNEPVLPSTPNFSWNELITTKHLQYAEQQREGLNNPNVRGALMTLAQDILQPIRNYIARPLNISSAYRCPALNASLDGASANSQHMKGEAADIFVKGWSDPRLYDLWLVLAFTPDRIYPGFGAKLGQVIYEDGRPGQDGGAWIHISLGAPFRAAARSGQKLTYSPKTGWRTWQTAPPPDHAYALLGGPR